MASITLALHERCALASEKGISSALAGVDDCVNGALALEAMATNGAALALETLATKSSYSITYKYALS
jgi:hypothetical protein